MNESPAEVRETTATPENQEVKIEDFETYLEKLKKCVNLLEDNKLTLAESLRTYQQASELAEMCERQLAIVDEQMHTISEKLSK